MKYYEDVVLSKSKLYKQKLQSCQHFFYNSRIEKFSIFGKRDNLMATHATHRCRLQQKHWVRIEPLISFVWQHEFQSNTQKNMCCVLFWRWMLMGLNKMQVGANFYCVKAFGSALRFYSALRNMKILPPFRFQALNNNGSPQTWRFRDSYKLKKLLKNWTVRLRALDVVHTGLGVFPL